MLKKNLFGPNVSHSLIFVWRSYLDPCLKKKINQNKTKKTPKTKQSTKQSEQCSVKLLLNHIVSQTPQNQTN